MSDIDLDQTQTGTDSADDGEPDLEQLRFPVGRLTIVPLLTRDQRESCIDEIAALPTNLRRALQDLGEAHLDTPYRPDGWTVRQVVHHLPDSHMNSYIRFKLGITEDEPTVGAYQEALWAEQPDARTGPLEPSLQLLEALHARWGRWMKGLEDADWQRVIHHPENGRMTLEQLLQVYCWHSRHHVAHITRLRDRMGWN